ncbi:MAG TPA: CsbD family protein [Pirellulaceae bacterium]|nr:CsbD family protein [Pirellulaceae bacterium]
MVNQQTLQGNWNEIRGRLRSKWGQLTGDDLQTFNGNVDQLVGLIQRKTGEARSSIESFLEELTSNGASSIGQAAESVREYATQFAHETSKRAGEAAQTVRESYEQAEDMIRQRPGESAAVCFGAGVLVGVLLGLVLRR